MTEDQIEWQPMSSFKGDKKAVYLLVSKEQSSYPVIGIYNKDREGEYISTGGPEGWDDVGCELSKFKCWALIPAVGRRRWRFG